MPWIDACSESDLDAESARRVVHAEKVFALFRNDHGEFYCTDGLCTHEDVDITDGLVMVNTVTCPKHASIFDFTTGEPETPPACRSLRTYRVKVESGRVKIEI